MWRGALVLGYLLHCSCAALPGILLGKCETRDDAALHYSHGQVAGIFLSLTWMARHCL